jgi:hypothetical protein
MFDLIGDMIDVIFGPFIDLFKLISGFICVTVFLALAIYGFLIIFGVQDSIPLWYVVSIALVFIVILLPKDRLIQYDRLARAGRAYSFAFITSMPAFFAEMIFLPAISPLLGVIAFLLAFAAFFHYRAWTCRKWAELSEDLMIFIWFLPLFITGYAYLKDISIYLAGLFVLVSLLLAMAAVLYKIKSKLSKRM